MNREIERLKNTRTYLLDLIKDLSAEQLNEIPLGFNNNIIWNLGHLIVSQQGLCYLRAGLKPIVDEQYFTDYKPQTKPNSPIQADEINTIKTLFLSVLDKLETDYNQSAFSNYGTFTTPYGVEITNIDEAINFILFHEGLHTGYIMAMKRLLK
ncbi:DinB family protein [Spirosoma spitsbergense]|uniref:DinB family protein n=1 Tax=Spirosoma spitsbergense TaxID=431554 RepID=UPI0003747E03|nr:DinB family protein [Spirosoma spitsbergense]